MIDLDRLDTDPKYRTTDNRPANADDMRSAALDRLRTQAPAARTTDFVKTTAQASSKAIGFVMVLLRKLDAHNAPVGAVAREWWMKTAIVDDNTGRVVGSTLNRDQVSDVINRLKGHLEGPQVVVDAPAAPVAPDTTPKRTYDAYDDVTDGNYAITDANGKNHFYRVSRREGKGQYAGRTFINLQERASEELFRVQDGWAVKARILDAIRTAGVEASHLAYATLLSRCWHCHTALTDNTQPHFARGLGPYCGENH